VGYVNSYEVYQVRQGYPATRNRLTASISWVDPNVAMDPYCDKPWAL
jgi:hypothetical protein